MAASIYYGVARSVHQARLLLGRKQIRDLIYIKKNPCSTKADTKALTEKQPLTSNKSSADTGMGNLTVPSKLQKIILVHFKHYPNIEAVPARVSFSKMNRAMSQYRIKVSLGMMVGTLILCFCTAWYGKTHQRETSLVDINLARHAAYRQGQDFTGRRLALITGTPDFKKEEEK